MKKKIRRRRCKNCDGLYKPDHRTLKRQKFCRKSECREASKRYSQQKWLPCLKICLIFALTFNIIFMLLGMKIPVLKGRRICLILALYILVQTANFTCAG